MNKLNKHTILIAALVGCLAPVSCIAAKIGDPAAPLVLKQWIKDNPVDVRDGKNIYVLEFWAASDPASRASIIKLAELQNSFEAKGVIVVGISEDSADAAWHYVELMNKEIRYSIAVDDEHKTANAYMKTYGQARIPCAFVVGKDGRVLWYGHPLAGLDKALDEITAGRYDLQKAMTLDAVRAGMDEYLSLARAGDPKARELGRKLLETSTNDVVRLCDFAIRIASDSRNTNRDLALAGEVLDKVEKLAPTKTAHLVVARGVVLFESGKQDEGIALAKQAVNLARDEKEKTFIETYYLHPMEERKSAAAKKKGDSK